MKKITSRQARVRMHLRRMIWLMEGGESSKHIIRDLERHTRAALRLATSAELAAQA